MSRVSRNFDLEDSFPLSVVGHQVVSSAELIIFGQVVSAHDSETQRNACVSSQKDCAARGRSRTFLIRGVQAGAPSQEGWHI